jgi:TIR domain
MNQRNPSGSKEEPVPGKHPILMKKAFIAWSGTPSQIIAECLREHLPNVIDVDLWLSSHDLPAGHGWFKELREQMADTDIGLLVFTSENTTSEWMQFEAGALAKLEKSKIIPLCLDVAANQLPAPLQQFQTVHLLNGEHAKLIGILNEELHAGFDAKQVESKGDTLRLAIQKAVADAASKIETNASDPLRVKTTTLETLESFAAELRHARYERLVKAAAKLDICNLCHVNKNQETNIHSVLMQMRQTLCSEYKIPSSYIDIHIVGRKFYKEKQEDGQEGGKAYEEWDYLFPLDESKPRRTPAAQLIKKSLARTALDLNRAYFFYDKKLIPKELGYFPSINDESFQLEGSIFVCPFLFNVREITRRYVLNIKSYGRKICQEEQRFEAQTLLIRMSDYVRTELLLYDACCDRTGGIDVPSKDPDPWD